MHILVSNHAVYRARYYENGIQTTAIQHVPQADQVYWYVPRKLHIQERCSLFMYHHGSLKSLT
jgi:hypothetical protein